MQSKIINGCTRPVQYVHGSVIVDPSPRWMRVCGMFKWTPLSFCSCSGMISEYELFLLHVHVGAVEYRLNLVFFILK